MSDKALNIENVLNIIFKTTTKSTQFFADSYLRKDISVISRWRNNSAVPKFEDIKKIVEFAVNESTGVQRVVIKDEIIKLIENCSFKKDIKNVILEKETFHDFLLETLSALSIEHQANIMEANNIKPFTCESSSKYRDFEAGESGIQSNDIPVDMEDIGGDYSGIVKFDLVLLKQKGNKKRNISDDHKKEADTRISQGDMTKIKKYILSRMTLGIIVIITISAYIIVQASNNHSDDSANNTLVYQTATHSAQINSTTSTPIHDSPFSPPPPQVPTRKPINEPTPTPKTKAKDRSAAGQKENKSANTIINDTENTNSNIGSNNSGTINNYYIEIEGNQNDVAAGNSTIVHEKE